MSKKQTNLLTALAVDAAPADHDFVIDAKYAQLVLNVLELTGGTTPGITLSVVQLIEAGFDLAYDNQTANFNVGTKVRGTQSYAEGIIALDTDAGATGTLRLIRVQGKFLDNEEIIDAGGTPGRAYANGSTTPVYKEGGQWASISNYTTSGGQAVATLANPDALDAANDEIAIIPRRFRLKVTEEGTWAAATTSFLVDMIVSQL